MVRRGATAIPSGLRILRGESPDTSAEPRPLAVDPEPPADASPAVLQVWRRVAAELSSMGMLYAADTDALRCYCEAVAIHEQASADLVGAPLMVPELGQDRGRRIANPLLRIQRDAALAVRHFAQEFGLTPSARVGVRGKGRQEPEKNPFAGTGTS